MPKDAQRWGKDKNLSTKKPTRNAGRLFYSKNYVKIFNL
jgi:hypothetical protein